MIQDLMVKAQDIFLDHFARLGVFSKVYALVGPPDVSEQIEECEQPSTEQSMYYNLVCVCVGVRLRAFAYISLD